MHELSNDHHDVDDHYYYYYYYHPKIDAPPDRKTDADHHSAGHDYSGYHTGLVWRNGTRYLTRFQGNMNLAI